MTAYLIPGVLGLLTGLLLHWTGLSRSVGVYHALGLRRSIPLRSGLSALGYGFAGTALLTWLAVIDVDLIKVLPLSLGVLIGGALLGVCCGLCGFTPTTAFASLGSGVALEALSTLAGCFAMTWLLPTLSGLISPLQSAAPHSAATLFEVTLDEPFLLGGGYLGLGCVGVLLVVIAVCIPNPKPVILTEEAIAAKAAEVPVPDPAPEDVPDPESAADEAFVAILEGEEPLIVDTEAPGEAPEEAPDEASEPDGSQED